MALLEGAILRDPADARSAFYLAMTHLWLGEHTEAIAAFQRRIALGGFAEEVFLSKMGIAESMEKRGDPWPEVLAAYLDAHAQRPHRAEPLYRIALHYSARKEHALCLLFARRAMDLPFPSSDIHFVDAEVYAWKVLDLVGTSAYWVGELTLGETAAAKAVAARPHDARLRQNLAFYARRRSG